MTETLTMLEQMDRYTRLKRETRTEDRVLIFTENWVLPHFS
ncbi:hypothetical protein [Acetobacter conturbans]|nr:hypothetical protein [Acetobacter conturbans]